MSRRRTEITMGGPTSKLNPLKLAADRDAFEKLEPAIHTKARLSIVSLLAANESLSFIELRDGLRLTDGNLAAHLRALEDARLIRLRKTGNPNKPTTLVALSAAGRAAFARYLEGLEHIVNRHR
jgi:DNA-binding transcriptional ArsR family regulator